MVVSFKRTLLRHSRHQNEIIQRFLYNNYNNGNLYSAGILHVVALVALFHIKHHITDVNAAIISVAVRNSENILLFLPASHLLLKIIIQLLTFQRVVEENFVATTSLNKFALRRTVVTSLFSIRVSNCVIFSRNCKQRYNNLNVCCYYFSPSSVYTSMYT